MTKLNSEQEAALDAMRNRRESGASVLTDEEKRRIREEEQYRAQVRGEHAQQQARANAPSYWLGFFLNLLVMGLGHLVIGEFVWAVVWFVAALVVIPATGFITWPLFAIGVLIHYRSIYARKYQ